MKRWICPAILALAGLGHAATETVYGAASLAQPADQAGVGARALAMGSAYVGVAEGSPALVWNPAGLAEVKGMDLSLHHNSGLAGSVQESLIFASPLGAMGGLAAGFNYINNGTVEGRDAAGNLTSGYNVGSMGFQLGWGREMLPGLSLGLAAKATSQSLGDAVYSSFAGDLAGLWQPLQGVKVGLNYANLGTSVGGSTKANGLRLGGSLALPMGANQVLVAASTQFQPGGVSRIQLGAEDLISGMIALRAGYQLNLAEQGYEGLSGMTLGVGFQRSSFSLDYAYIPFGDLGSSQRVSLAYQFSPAKEEPVNRAEAKAADPAPPKASSRNSVKKRPKASKK